MATPQQIWAFPVNRGGKAIPALQELADGKTLALQNQAALTALTTLVKALPGVDPAALDASIQRAIADALEDVQVDVDYDRIATVVDAAVADDFDALEQVVKQLPEDVRARLSAALDA